MDRNKIIQPKQKNSFIHRYLKALAETVEPILYIACVLYIPIGGFASIILSLAKMSFMPIIMYIIIMILGIAFFKMDRR